MNRDEKAAAVAELTANLKEADAVFAVDYRGISVTEAAELRAKLRDADAVFKVVKNRLAKRAASDAGTDGIEALLVGPTALTLIKGDAVIAAKAISDFARDHEELEYKGGLMDGAALDPEGFKVIARLPGVDVLHGQLVGLAASPLTGLLAGMSNMISGLGRQLAQVAEQGLVTGEAPAAPAGAEAEEAPAEEPAAEAESEAPAAAEAEEEPAAEAEEEPSAEAEEEEPPAEEPPAEEPAAEAEAPAAEEETSEEPADAEASGETETETNDVEDSESEEPAEETPAAEGSEEGD